MQTKPAPTPYTLPSLQKQLKQLTVEVQYVPRPESSSSGLGMRLNLELISQAEYFVFILAMKRAVKTIFECKQLCHSMAAFGSKVSSSSMQQCWALQANRVVPSFLFVNTVFFCVVGINLQAFANVDARLKSQSGKTLKFTLSHCTSILTCCVSNRDADRLYCCWYFSDVCLS